MWSIHYRLHFTITHSLLKRPSQICYKKHQHSWKKGIEYMFDTNYPYFEQQYKNLFACFKNQKCRKISHSQFLTRNTYPYQKYWKLALKIVFFLPHTMTYVIKILYLSERLSWVNWIGPGYLGHIGGELFQPHMGQFTYWTSTVPVIGDQFRVHVLRSKTLFWINWNITIHAA